MKFRIIPIAAAYLFVLANTPAQAQQEELAKRIQTGITLIKLGCGTETSAQSTKVSGNVSGQLTLSKPPGLVAGGTVNFSKDEAQGLVAALQKELTENSVQLSVRQLDCMKPYVDAIFKELFPPPRSNRDGLREALEEVRTAYKSTVRRSSAGEPYSGEVTFEIKIDDGTITVVNDRNTRYGKLADLSSDIEAVKMVDPNEPKGEKGLQFLRLNCRMSECFTETRSGKFITKRKNAIIYLIVDMSALPLKQALSKVLQYY